MPSNTTKRTNLRFREFHAVVKGNKRRTGRSTTQSAARVWLEDQVNNRRTWHLRSCSNAHLKGTFSDRTGKGIKWESKKAKNGEES